MNIKNNRQFIPAHANARRTRIIIIAVVAGLIFVIPFFRHTVLNTTSGVGTGVIRSTKNTGGFLGSLITAVRSKEALENENNSLQEKIKAQNLLLVDHDVLLNENTQLKSTLGRNSANHFVLAAVLGKPPYSLYDTLLIDGGSNVGFKNGQIVYASETVPLGVIEETRASSALVRLYSSSGEKTEARLSPSNIDVTLTGSGGGNFTTTVPHDFVVAQGTTAITKELKSGVLAVYKKVISDTRDPLQTLLLSAPVNMSTLNYVEVRQ